MHTFVLVVHIILAVLMIGLILVQHGKGALVGGASLNAESFYKIAQAFAKTEE